MSNLILKTVQGTAQVDSQPAFSTGKQNCNQVGKPGFFKLCWKSTIFTWRRAYKLFSDAVEGKVLGRLFYLELNLNWIPMRDRLDLSCFPQQPDHKPPSFRPPSSLCTGIGSCLSLVHSASYAISLPVCSCSLLLLPSLFLSLVIGLVSLSRRFHLVVLRL